MNNNQKPVKHHVLLCGLSGSGKSRSLKNIPNPRRTVLFSCDAGKMLPFKTEITQISITDPLDVLQALNELKDSNDFDIVIIDTLTYLMEMYETQYVLTAEDTRSAWSGYAQFFKELMTKAAECKDKQFYFLAHTDTEISKTGDMVISCPVKGSLKKQSLESMFTTVIGVCKQPISELKKYPNKLLTITDRDTKLGFKHVFQTKTTEKTVGDKIKGPEDLFSDEETFIDNDCGVLQSRLNEYFNN